MGENEGAFQTVSGHCLKTAGSQTMCCEIAYGLTGGGNPDLIGFTANYILLGEEPAGKRAEKKSPNSFANLYVFFRLRIHCPQTLLRQ